MPSYELEDWSSYAWSVEPPDLDLFSLSGDSDFIQLREVPFGCLADPVTKLTLFATWRYSISMQTLCLNFSLFFLLTQSLLLFFLPCATYHFSTSLRLFCDFLSFFACRELSAALYVQFYDFHLYLTLFLTVLFLFIIFWFPFFCVILFFRTFSPLFIFLYTILLYFQLLWFSLWAFYVGSLCATASPFFFSHSPSCSLCPFSLSMLVMSGS